MVRIGKRERKLSFIFLCILLFVIKCCIFAGELIINHYTNSITTCDSSLSYRRTGKYTLCSIAIEKYNHLINIAKYDQQDDDNLTVEDLRKIAAAREQAKQGLGISSEEVHKKVKELK